MSSRSSGVALGLGSQPGCSTPLPVQRNSFLAPQLLSPRSRSFALFSQEDKSFSGYVAAGICVGGGEPWSSLMFVPKGIHLLGWLWFHGLAYLCHCCFARSFSTASDVLGAGLLDHDYSIPDPQLVRRIVSQVEF